MTSWHRYGLPIELLFSFLTLLCACVGIAGLSPIAGVAMDTAWLTKTVHIIKPIKYYANLWGVHDCGSNLPFLLARQASRSVSLTQPAVPARTEDPPDLSSSPTRNS